MSTNLLFFGIYPYVALLICLVGSWARFDLSQYTWKAGSSQMLSKKGMRVYSNLFHVGVLFILAGHFVGLLTPASVYHHLISTENKQLLAMVSGGFFGVLCFIGLSGLILRRLTDARVRATGNASDLMILLVLYAQLILGLSTIVASTHHMDGSVMVMLADWAQAIVTLRPLAAPRPSRRWAWSTSCTSAWALPCSCCSPSPAWCTSSARRCGTWAGATRSCVRNVLPEPWARASGAGPPNRGDRS